MDNRVNILKLFLCGLLFLASMSIAVQAQPAGQIISIGNRTYYAGDLADTTWAHPNFDDSDWAIIPMGTFPYDSWRGIGLFRQVFEVDSTLWDVPLALSVTYTGALDFYLDGELIHRFGTVGKSKKTEVARNELYPSPRPIIFRVPPNASGSTSRHVIAVRYSRFTMEDPAWAGNQSSIDYMFGFPVHLSEARVSAIRKISIHQMLLTGVGLAFAFLHLILFVFHRPLRANLYFSGLAACSALLAFFTFEHLLSTDPTHVIWFLRLHNVTGLAMALIGLRLVYLLYLPRLPRQYWGFAVVGAALCVWTLFRPYLSQDALSIFVLIVMAEIARPVIVARFRNSRPLLEESWILETGLAILWVVVIHDLLMALDVIRPFWDFIDFPAVRYATLSLMIAMSVMLGREFGRTKKDLETQLVQVKALSEKTLQQELERVALEAENRRKQMELDGARLLQLSMLPATLPEHPTVELAAYMKTATEVGGDYYDFDVAEDGTLTIAIGDATGHGLQAGTMVAATKSLFNLLASEQDLEQVLRRSTRALKRMNLPKLYMALALAKLRGHTLELAGAGMPPALLYRATSGYVEQIPLKGMPLGGPGAFPYRKTSVPLSPGDTVVLMSDGFPELFNDAGEMLGYDRAVRVFEEVASRSPEEIIAHLTKTVETWANGRAQDDDVTFVVMKVKKGTGGKGERTD